jgi:hypothetical protein
VGNKKRTMKKEKQNRGGGTARPLRKLGVQGFRPVSSRQGRGAGDDLPLAQWCKEFNRRADAWMNGRGAGS